MHAPEREDASFRVDATTSAVAQWIDRTLLVNPRAAAVAVDAARADIDQALRGRPTDRQGREQVRCAWIRNSEGRWRCEMHDVAEAAGKGRKACRIVKISRGELRRRKRRRLSHALGAHECSNTEVFGERR
jgi:hypothetical protein